MRMIILALCAALLGCGSAAAPPAPPPYRCPPLTFMQQVRAPIAQAQIAANEGVILTGITYTASFAEFCRFNALSVACAGGAGRKLTLVEVDSIDRSLRARFEYRDDVVQYGRTDPWMSGVTCGDCEDYALTLADDLHRAGAGGDSLRLMLWSPQPGAGHATLLIETADAGLIEVGVNWNETPRAYDPNRGVRFTTLRFDGSRLALPAHLDPSLPQKEQP